MRLEALMFIAIGAFTAVIAAIYWFASHEPSGTTLLGLGVGLGVIPGLWLLRSGTRWPARPEDLPDGDPDAGVGTVGSFPASSIWPFVLAAGAALGGVGLVFGLWAALPGIVLLGAGFVGGTLESRT